MAKTRLQILLNNFVTSRVCDIEKHELGELCSLLVNERAALTKERDALAIHLSRSAIGCSENTVKVWDPDAVRQWPEFLGYWLVHSTTLTQMLLKAEAEALDDEDCKEDPRKEPEEDEDDPEEEAKEEPEGPAEKAPFSVGDYVYIGGGSIGRIHEVRWTAKSGYIYDVQYCQGKDLETGPRGGYGSVWSEGYPKPVENNPADVLYVAAMHEKELRDRLDKEAGEAAKRFGALKESRRILLANSKRKEGEGDV